MSVEVSDSRHFGLSFFRATFNHLPCPASASGPAHNMLPSGHCGHTRQRVNFIFDSEILLWKSEVLGAIKIGSAKSRKRKPTADLQMSIQQCHAVRRFRLRHLKLSVRTELRIGRL